MTFQTDEFFGRADIVKFDEADDIIVFQANPGNIVTITKYLPNSNHQQIRRSAAKRFCTIARPAYGRLAEHAKSRAVNKVLITLRVMFAAGDYRSQLRPSTMLPSGNRLRRVITRSVMSTVGPCYHCLENSSLFANGWTARQAREAMHARPERGQLEHRLLRSAAARGAGAGQPVASATGRGADGFSAQAVSAAALAGPSKLASFLGAEPTRLIFTANVSCAINIVASGLTLAHPGEVLLTDHEYGAMHWCWERAAQRQGLTLRTFPLADPGRGSRRDRRRRLLGR